MAIHLLEAYPTANTNMNLQMDQQSKHNEAWEGRRGELVACASQLASLLCTQCRTTVAMMLINLAWQVKGKKKGSTGLATRGQYNSDHKLGWGSGR